MSSKFPEELKWMDGRSVFERPESPASVVMGRSVITTSEEQAALSDIYATTREERLAMSPEDRARELADMLAMQRHYEETGEIPDLTE